MKKTLLLLVLIACSFPLLAQLNAEQNNSGQTAKSDYYKELIEGKKFTHEADLYLGAGWGLGYQLRREFNQYVGWNIIGISYMNDFSSPADVSLINLKLVGIRGYTPSHKWFRGYGDMCLGYSFQYDYGYCYHHLGIDLNLGIQVHKKFAFGIDLIYCTPDPFGYIGARFSYIL